MRYLLLCVICFMLIVPDIFAQDETLEPLPATELPAIAVTGEPEVVTVATFDPLSETELMTDGTQRPSWLDGLTLITGLLTLGAVATVAVNSSRRKS